MIGAPLVEGCHVGELACATLISENLRFRGSRE